METKKAIGRQGWWFASVDGKALPCVHKYWWPSGAIYHDPFERHEGRNIQNQLNEYVGAIMNGHQVILTDDKAMLDSNGKLVGFQRSRYIAVYDVDDVEFSVANGLRFRFVRRLHELEP
ncbi:hypothetical protein [Devosia sp. A16]|uniref:hypothetical protein n=1 Tax=Devosia sp. A16 TaxID=1736675 RepID=UPI0006D79D1D|nr:hypothetical protein [Devosia sp. A16]